MISARSVSVERPLVSRLVALNASREPVILTSACKGVANTEKAVSTQHFVDSPSAAQREAVETLRGFNDDTVLAWLIDYRASQESRRNRHHISGLSTEQFAAISTLSECSNHVIFTWLHRARRSGVYAPGELSRIS